MKTTRPPIGYTVLLDHISQRAMERLRRTYELETKADVYDLAVRVLTWATGQMVIGYEIGRHKDGVFQRLNMPRAPNEKEWRP